MVSLMILSVDLSLLTVWLERKKDKSDNVRSILSGSLNLVCLRLWVFDLNSPMRQRRRRQRLCRNALKSHDRGVVEFRISPSYLAIIGDVSSEILVERIFTHDLYPAKWYHRCNISVQPLHFKVHLILVILLVNTILVNSPSLISPALSFILLIFILFVIYLLIWIPFLLATAVTSGFLPWVGILLLLLLLIPFSIFFFICLSNRSISYTDISSSATTVCC